MKNNHLFRMTLYALMAAVMCVLGPMSIPIGVIPITLTNFVILVSVYLVGTRGTLIAYLLYMLLGAAGLPVFSGFQGGLAKLVGPTGGYLVGYSLLILATGFAMERTNRHPVRSFSGMLVGTALLYTFGTVWFVLQTHSSFAHAMSICVLPFIPFDIVKMVLSLWFGRLIRVALQKNHLLPD